MKVGIVGLVSWERTHAAGWAETPAEIVGFTAETQQEAGASSRATITQKSIQILIPCSTKWMFWISAPLRICITKWR